MEDMDKFLEKCNFPKLNQEEIEHLNRSIISTEKATFLHCWWECKLMQPLWKMAWSFLKTKLGIKPPYDPAIPLLGIYPEETKIEKDTCIPLFTAALSTIARTWSNLSSIQSSRSVVSDSLRPHESQHTRPSCPSQTPGAYSNPCPSSQWCHLAISSSVIPFSCPQSLPASGSFPTSQLFAWGGQTTGVSASASVLPMNTQDWSPLGWTGWISLQSKGLFNGLLQHHSSKASILWLSAFFTVQLSHLHDH